jgi:prefoldin subunit 5
VFKKIVDFLKKVGLGIVGLTKGLFIKIIALVKKIKGKTILKIVVGSIIIVNFIASVTYWKAIRAYRKTVTEKNATIQTLSEKIVSLDSQITELQKKSPKKRK